MLILRTLKNPCLLPVFVFPPPMAVNAVPRAMANTGAMTSSTPSLVKNKRLLSFCVDIIWQLMGAFRGGLRGISLEGDGKGILVIVALWQSLLLSVRYEVWKLGVHESIDWPPGCSLRGHCPQGILRDAT